MCIHIVKGSCALQEKCHCHPHMLDLTVLHPSVARLVRLMTEDDSSLTVQECLAVINEASKERNVVGYRFDVV